MQRRDFLRGVGALTVGAAATMSASAATPSRPSHITAVGDDPAELEKYLPSVIMSRESRQQLIGVYGWWADSEDYDLRAYYYWFKYNTQQSFFERLLPFLSPDAHFEDHEPFIAFVDPETGEIDRTVKSGYHHMALEIDGEDAALREDRVDGQATHIKLRVIDPWRQFRHAADAARDGVLPDTISGAEFGSWLTEREDWYDNEIYEKSSTDAVEDPFVMLERDHWWAEGSRDAWLAKNVWSRLGLRGYDESDTLRYED